MNCLCRLSCALVLLAWFAPSGYADEFRPAYLQLTQIDETTYDVLWKIPAIEENTTLRVKPVFPSGTESIGSVTSSFAGNATAQRWRIRATGGLAGKSVTFTGLANTRTDALVRIVRADGTTQLGRVLPVDARIDITASPGAFEVVRTYTVLGIEHILTGFDHLLFVLALLILVSGKGRLIATVTAFTLAHSVTLALATLGVLHVPGPPVEALIALSIVFVASEIVYARQGQPGLSQRSPWIVAFVFGLLHGLGFAGALAEVGLPPLSIPTALLCFNVGVEMGQLIFITAVFGLVAFIGWMVQSVRVLQPVWLWRVPPYLIGGIASYWVFERIASF